MRVSKRLFTLLAMILAMAACTSSPGESASDTPTRLPPTERATEAPIRPDLVIRNMYIEMEGRRGPCVDGYTPYGLRVVVENVGTADAGPFYVEMNGSFQRVGVGLKAGKYIELQFTGTAPSGRYQATADATNLIAESREDNNSMTYLAPTPTPPPLCTPMPAATP